MLQDYDARMVSYRHSTIDDKYQSDPPSVRSCTAFRQEGSNTGGSDVFWDSLRAKYMRTTLTMHRLHIFHAPLVVRQLFSYRRVLVLEQLLLEPGRAVCHQLTD